MKRDGENISLWQDTIVLDVSSSETRLRQYYDVIIIGAGITGVTSGLLLQAAGKNCLILEANSVGFGTTSGTTAHLNTVLDTHYSDIIKDFGIEAAHLTAKGTNEAIQIVSNLISKYNIDCDFQLCDGYMYATDADQEKKLDEILKGVEEVGITSSYTNKLPPSFNYTKAITFASQGRFHPLKYLAALLKEFERIGGHIIEGVTVTKVLDENPYQKVITANDNIYESDKVVYATHTPPGIHLLTFKLSPYRSYVMGFELEDNHNYPKDLIYDMKDPYHYFRSAEYKNRNILIVGGQDHKTGHDTNSDFNFTQLESFVRKSFSVSNVVYKWSSQYYESTDGLPYIGYFPGKKSKRQYIATGYGGNGMIFGTLSAHIISGLILNGESEYQNLFSPSRVKPIVGFKNFITGNFDVAKRLVMDRVSINEINNSVEIAKGEGKIIELRGVRVGLFKDLNGTLHAVDPICKHACCIVQWNTAEKSWDCPCHGARYSFDGELLTGPSTEGLTAIDLEDLGD